MLKINRLKLPRFSPALKKAAAVALNRSAEWLIRTQVRDAWPFWNANKGRYLYHIFIDPKRRAKDPTMYSTCWKTSRAAQGMYSAYLVTGDKSQLESARLASQYVTTLQIFDPSLERWRGSFLEDSPMGPHTALRDGMEAVQAFINDYLITGDKRLLRRAEIGTEFFLGAFNGKRFTSGLGFPYLNKPGKSQDAFCFYAGALPAVQVGLATGNKALVRAAAPMMDVVMQKFILDDGSFGLKGAVPGGHHTNMPAPYDNRFSNDDGVGVAMLATWAATGKTKYLDSAVGMGDFWPRTGVQPPPLAAYPSVALFLTDLYRITGDRQYLPVIEQFIEKTLSLQCSSRDGMLNGGFIGEDMAKHYDKKSKPTDYVDLRITSYAMIALAKIACRKPADWGCAYSCFGF